jgi:phosphoribosylaminoimidazolecarboxamide formyltransferase/IMP cyclohydrolase
MDKNSGALSQETRFELARKVFNYTASYDAAISNYLNDLQGEQEPLFLNLSFKRKQKLRYGENPHQAATLYSDLSAKEGSLVSARQLQGKELSFNNILDFDAALSMANEFEEKCVVIVKHNNPAGVAIGSEADSLASVFEDSWSSDPVSAFGSVIAINREVDPETAEKIVQYFIEGIVAPSFHEEALRILAHKKNLRLMELGSNYSSPKKYDIKRVSGGLLFQEEDALIYHEDSLKIVTQSKPTEEQMLAMRFNWKICKYVKSNAIVLGNGSKIFGIGAGQMSRVDSVQIAGSKAKKFGHDTIGGVLASDAFFPFRDGIDLANEFGIKSIIQPGGSVKDEEVIQACNEHQIAMVFTGMRHFKH